MNIKLLISRSLGILIAGALVLATVQSVPDEAIPPVEALILNERGESFEPFFNDMHDLLEANTLPDQDGHYFLPLQKPGRPSWWISVEVKGDDIERRGLMYYRSDNIYFVGFMNQDGTLYCVTDAIDGNMFTQGCTSLGFRSNYHDLTGRPDDRLLDLGPLMQREQLGRPAAMYAANVFVEYGITIHDPAEAKRAMLIYAIMISEGLRFKPIGDLVKQSWLNPASLTVQQSYMIFAWQDMSILFCRKIDRTTDSPEWSRGKNKLARAKMESLQDLSNALDFVKGEKQCMRWRKEKKNP